MRVVIPSPVLATVPADPKNARILRMVASAVASGVGLGMDRLEDLALAIDEASGVLLGVAGTTSLECAITPVGDGVEVRVRSVGGRGAAWPLPSWSDSLERLVLTSVTDAVEPMLDAGEPSIRFTISA